ncbi:hypothetical protein Clacol_004453 [Clathrus columnatus]|uniref:Uncharacterized protein n=1 Tax=Clathrus columnatus TaxID=1419009 RepID=A0AAV5A9I1_9AGAM|nr:hypothetical protein Clacol_004453 [Clathrus columnatus]
MSIHLPSVITLTKLISLDDNCYALIQRLRAPALRRLNVQRIHTPELDQQGCLIFDEYDLSPITQLVVSNAFGILRQPQNSSLVIEGLTAGSTPRNEDPWAPLEMDQYDLKHCNEDPWTPFEMDQDTNYDHIDLHSINVSFSGPTQFHIGLPTYNTPNDGVAPPDFQPSPTLSKILSKLHNLERLYITPFSMVDIYQDLSSSDCEPLKRFLNIFFDNLISLKIKQLGIMEVGRNPYILRLIFDLVNNCFALSNLDTIELGNFGAGLWHRNYFSVHDFAEELVNSLKSRQKAGHRALPRLEVDLGTPLPKKCIAEAAMLGTQINVNVQ